MRKLTRNLSIAAFLLFLLKGLLWLALPALLAMKGCP